MTTALPSTKLIFKNSREFSKVKPRYFVAFYFLSKENRMDEQVITQHLLNLGFSETQVASLLAAGSQLELPTRHVLTHQGQFASDVYLLLEGMCLEEYLLGGERSVVKECYWPGEWLINTQTLIQAAPANTLLETLSPCLLFCLPIETLRTWRADQHPLYLALLEQRLIVENEKNQFTKLYTASERYQILIGQFAQSMTELSAAQLAQCLTITETELDALRNEHRN